MTPETWRGIGLATTVSIELTGCLLGGALLGNWLAGAAGALGGVAVGLAAGLWLVLRTLPRPPE